MYILNRKGINKKVKLKELSGISFGISNKKYNINDSLISNLYIYDNYLVYPVAYKQVIYKYNKLLKKLPDLLVTDDDGESIRHALNEIERFRQIVKKKYRKYLKQKDLEMMEKKLKLFQQIAKTNYIELKKSYLYTETKSSHK